MLRPTADELEARLALPHTLDPFDGEAAEGLVAEAATLVARTPTGPG